MARLHNFGTSRVPPMSLIMVLTDRDDEALWALTHDTTLGWYAITDELPGPFLDFVTYGPFDGPVIGIDPKIRLLVRGGHLGFEALPLPGAVGDWDQARILSRRRREYRRGLEIVKPTGWEPGEALAYQSVEF